MAASPPTIACSRCGALNAGDFSNCIRCNQPLEGAAPASEAAAGAPRLRVETAPRGRVVLGGGERLLGRWEASSLPVTKLILAINLAVFALQALALMQIRPGLGGLLFPTGDMTYNAIAFQFGAMPPEIVWRGHEQFRLLSACFVHFGLLHVGMNMYGLIYLSRLVEPALGSVRYLIAYVAAGIIGFAMSVAWSALTGNWAFTAGASGAVFGVMGMVLGFLWRRRDPRWKSWLMRGVVFSLLFTFMMPGINHAAHLGGLVSGTLFGALFAKGAPKPSRGYHRVIAALCLLACLGSLVATQLSPLNEPFAQQAEQDRLRQIVEPD